MKRVLFLGNSHLSALKSAWEAAPPKGWEAEFFGAPQRAWLKMRLLPEGRFGLGQGGDGDIRRQRQVTEQANGRVSVDLSGRGHIVIVGGFSAALPLAMVLAQCDVAGLRETQAPTLLSQGLFADICLALASDALPEAGWRNRPGAEIALLPRPATAESCLGSTHESFAPWRSLATARDGLIAAFEAFDVALAGTFAKWGLSYLAQPYSTRTETGLTARRFLAEGGGEILHGAEHKRGDHAHMNQAYGAACLPSLLTWLDSGRTEQPS